jgi:hypothetical protein
MSSELSPLLSVTFHEQGCDHLIELVHQRDEHARRHLASVDVAVYDADGKMLGDIPVDPRDEIVDLARLLAGHGHAGERLMVVFDSRYDERVFPYRPHHYAFVHPRRAAAAPLYYAVNAVLGGVPDRIGATGINNFETYLFLRRRLAARPGLALGNPSRFATAEAQVFAYYGAERRTQKVVLEPKCHTEIGLPPTLDGTPLGRVEVKALFKLATYVLARRALTGELVLFDHLFTYFK